MRLPVSLFMLVAAVIVAAWWWLGAAVSMPPSPLAAGEKLHCVSYAPFRGQQSPTDTTMRIDAWQIEDDLARLRAVTGCVRTYATRNGLDQVPEIAARHGLAVMQGIWLGGDPALAERDLATAVDLAKRYPQVIRSLVVGNEVLLRGEMSATDLAATIRRVKAQVSAPVTYADVWEFWLRHREIHGVVDFVTIHILPYWEDVPIAAREAAAHVEAIRRKVTAELPGKEILIGETGWPSAGRMRAGALPSPANQARVMHEVLNVAERENYHVNLIEAFDQPWKRQLEGTVGGHWGLFDAGTRTPKFTWGGAVSNHPYWRLQAAGGVALAALVFGAALFARRAEAIPAPWLGVAASALAAGVLIGWAVENAPLESLTVGDWIRSCVLVALAIAAPVVGAAALVRAQETPTFADVLARRDVPRDWLAVALGSALIVLSVIAVQVALGLVFNPRYKDYPFAPLTAAAVPFLVLSLVGPRGAAARGAAETAFASVLAGSAAYIVLNEGFGNWQALWLGAVLAALALTLFRRRAAPG
jgi:glucan 1,3-beta-glucosidase